MSRALSPCVSLEAFASKPWGVSVPKLPSHPDSWPVEGSEVLLVPWLLCLMLLTEVCSCTVPAAASVPQRLVKASSAISAILLSLCA